ncbi:PilZ domain-containing protein [Desulfoplanes sp.]
MSTDTFTIEYTPSCLRKTLRVRCPNLRIQFSGNENFLPVRDISPGGLCFDIDPGTKKNFSIGQTYQVALYCDRGDILREILPALEFKVVHISSCIGGKIINLNRQSEKVLDTLILSIQKQQITQKNNSEHRENKTQAP